MSNFGERLPQEDLAFAYAQLVQATEYRIHPREDYATLAVFDGLVIKITDEGVSYRYDIHGNNPSELKMGETYRSIQVSKPSAVYHDGMIAEMAIVTKLSDHLFSSDVVIDDNGNRIHLERRYGTNWSIRSLDEPQVMTIAEMSRILERSSSVFLPEQELQEMFTESTKDNYRKWQSLTRTESTTTGNSSRIQKILSRLALLRG